MKVLFPLLAATLIAGSALAQSAPDDTKGNPPIKHAHTINDGGARAGANSFTQNQARKHFLHAGYSAVSGLTKGPDGIWRGTATKDGVTKSVALDFKGNVSENGS